MLSKLDNRDLKKYKRVIITFSDYQKIVIFTQADKIMDEDGLVHENLDLEIIQCINYCPLKFFAYETLIKSEFNVIRIEPR